MSDSRKVAGEIAGEIEKTFTDRGQVYGPPEINFGNIAAFWNAWIGSRYPEANVKLDAVDVGHMSSLIKKARMANTPDHRDSALDDATYTLLAAGIAAPAIGEMSKYPKGQAPSFNECVIHAGPDGAFAKLLPGDDSKGRPIIPGHPDYRGASPGPAKQRTGDAGNY